MAIEKFRGEYRWLSNFHECEAPIFLEGDSNAYPTTEHAYQAAKTFYQDYRLRIKNGDAVHAKRFFKNLKDCIRPDWNQVKLGIMEHCLRQKFAEGTELRKKLIATGTQDIIEGNTWGDVWWGVCNGKGQNHLGKLLMKLRSEFKIELRAQQAKEGKFAENPIQ